MLRETLFILATTFSPPDIKALNNTTNGGHTLAEPKPGFHL
jgi:hypothetical protein